LCRLRRADALDPTVRTVRRPVAQSISVYSAKFIRLLTACYSVLDRRYLAGLANDGQKIDFRRQRLKGRLLTLHGRMAVLDGLWIPPAVRRSYRCGTRLRMDNLMLYS
jgi:hypothetical protein